MTEKPGVYRMRGGPRKQAEHQEQAAVVAWAKLREERYPALRLLFAVPNAGRRSYAAAAAMKSEGLRAGVPDMLLPVPCGGYSGLAIEMKVKGGRVSDEQQWWLEQLDGYGWLAAVCWSAGEAIELLQKYVGGEA